MEKMELVYFNDAYKGKKVLVTGNTGFKGSWLTLWLQELGATVIGFSNEVPTDPSFYVVNGLPDSVQQYWGDIRDLKAVEEAVLSTRPDFIFHLAAQPLVKESFQEPLETFKTNGIGTAHVLEALRKADFPCTAIFITSDKCYENVEWVWGYKETDMLGGKDPYSASKAVAEIIFHSYYHSYFKEHPHIRLATVRAGNVIGGGDWANDRIVPDCIKNWAEGKEVSIRRPSSTRPWQHVLEPLSGYLLLGASLCGGKKLHGESFNFGPPAQNNFSVKELIHKLATYWTAVDAHALIDINEDQSFYEAGLLKLNTDKALFYLKWEPVLDFAETMRFTGEWYNHFYLHRHHTANISVFSQAQLAEYVQLAHQKNSVWVSRSEVFA